MMPDRQRRVKQRVAPARRRGRAGRGAACAWNHPMMSRWSRGRHPTTFWAYIAEVPGVQSALRLAANSCDVSGVEQAAPAQRECRPDW